jgi:hypothetical protein
MMFDNYMNEFEKNKRSICKIFWLNKAIQICENEKKLQELKELEKNLGSESCLSEFYKKLWIEDLKKLRESKTINQLLLKDSKTLNWDLFDFRNYPNEIEKEGKEKDWKMERESLRFIQSNMKVIHQYLFDLDLPTFQKIYHTHLSSFDLFGNQFLLESFIRKIFYFCSFFLI